MTPHAVIMERSFGFGSRKSSELLNECEFSQQVSDYNKCSIL